MTVSAISSVGSVSSSVRPSSQSLFGLPGIAGKGPGCDSLDTGPRNPRIGAIAVDKSEIRGGDAWDQKIRRQIRGCALFMPIISAHSQGRLEGEFRLEWKLAVDRSHLMAAEWRRRCTFAPSRVSVYSG